MCQLLVCVSPSGRIEDWDAALPHLDAAVGEIEGAFRALGIEMVAFDPAVIERVWDEAVVRMAEEEDA